MPNLTGGQAITESLKAQGVDTIFGIISIHNLDLFDALFDQQDNLRFIGGRLELGCGFMADGYARATGKPGVLITSTGPGAADSIGAMGEAYFSGSPLLQVTTNVESEFIGKGRNTTHEVKDQLRMFEAVTDWNAMIGDIESIPDNLMEAFQRFQNRRPRPIELELPTDILGNRAEVEIIGPRDPGIPQGDPARVEQALQLLLNARRPAIVVGEEVQMLGGTAEIVRLAEALGAPVVTSDGAKGAFPEDHPLSLGTMLGGRIWGENPAHSWLSTCDAVVILGSIMPHRSTTGVQLKLPDTVIHVLLDGESIGKNYDATVPIVANSQAVARQWLDAIGNSDVSKGQSYADEVASVKKDIHQTLQDSWANELRVFEAVREATPRDTVFSLDPTVPASRASRCLPNLRPAKVHAPPRMGRARVRLPGGTGGQGGTARQPGGLHHRRRWVPVQFPGAGHGRPV